MKYNNDEFIGLTVDSIQAQRQRDIQDMGDLENALVYVPLTITDIAEQIVATEIKIFDTEDKSPAVSRPGFGPWS